MGYAKGKNDITGKVQLTMLGSLREIPDKDMEERGKRERLKKVK